MKNLKRSILSGLTFFVAMGAALAFNVSGMLNQAIIFREVPGTSPNTVMENITSRCTLNSNDLPMCSAFNGADLPSENREYWSNAAKTGPAIPSSSVFTQIP